eukprot:TRINITY_DN4348_c2_g1_i1.p1 TRINITY_DN4348_c2_g1~~TRINITY_DN4348_c2_g1_i1.p1  ORF type:complete len:379 (-),score=75.86 TRINITY_DN4348_c2_g1_i1:347-1483(-)
MSQPSKYPQKQQATGLAATISPAHILPGPISFTSEPPPMRNSISHDSLSAFQVSQLTYGFARGSALSTTPPASQSWHAMQSPLHTLHALRQSIQSQPSTPSGSPTPSTPPLVPRRRGSMQSEASTDSDFRLPSGPVPAPRRMSAPTLSFDQAAAAMATAAAAAMSGQQTVTTHSPSQHPQHPPQRGVMKPHALPPSAPSVVNKREYVFVDYEEDQRRKMQTRRRRSCPDASAPNTTTTTTTSSDAMAAPATEMTVQSVSRPPTAPTAPGSGRRVSLPDIKDTPALPKELPRSFSGTFTEWHVQEPPTATLPRQAPVVPLRTITPISDQHLSPEPMDQDADDGSPSSSPGTPEQQQQQQQQQMPKHLVPYGTSNNPAAS